MPVRLGRRGKCILKGMQWPGSAWPWAASLAALAWGCSDGNAPKTGKGDTLIVDVDATNQPPQAMADAGADDSPYGAVADAYGGYSYSPTGVCSKCACGAGTYCFGGGTGYATFSGTCSGSSGLAVGCQPLPAACASAPTCDCLFQALRSEISCAPVCAGAKSPFTVYCPTP